MAAIQEKMPVQEIIALCEALTAKSKSKMGERHWIFDFVLSYDSIEKKWEAIVVDYIIQEDGTLDGRYEVESVTAATLEEAIAQLLKSKELERRLKD
jgi:hypothetical protein